MRWRRRLQPSAASVQGFSRVRRTASAAASSGADKVASGQEGCTACKEVEPCSDRALGFRTVVAAWDCWVVVPINASAVKLYLFR